MNKILVFVLFAAIVPGFLVITVAVSLLFFCFRDKVEQIIEHFEQRGRLAQDRGGAHDVEEGGGGHGGDGRSEHGGGNGDGEEGGGGHGGDNGDADGEDGIVDGGDGDEGDHSDGHGGEDDGEERTGEHGGGSLFIFIFIFTLSFIFILFILYARVI